MLQNPVLRMITKQKEHRYGEFDKARKMDNTTISAIFLFQEISEHGSIVNIIRGIFPICLTWEIIILKTLLEAITVIICQKMSCN